MDQEKIAILLPKIKKMTLRENIMLDPADFRKGLPTNKLPELHEKGLILHLASHVEPLSRMNCEGTLKMSVTYTAQVLILVGRYAQIQVIDDYVDVWIGTVLGMTVKGTGGKGTIRACKITGTKQETLLAEAIDVAPGNQAWKNLLVKVELLLRGK